MDDFPQRSRRSRKRDLVVAAFIFVAIACLTGFGRDVRDFGRGFHDGFVQSGG